MMLRALILALISFALIWAQNNSPSAAQKDNPAAALSGAPPILSCPAGSPLGSIDLRVQPPNTEQPLPFQTINHLSEGDTLVYSPILRGKEKRTGEISLVMVPEKREPGKDQLIVTDPKDADKPQQWKIAQTISLAGFIYGPQGLSKRNVKHFLAQDDLLIAQLADYAEKTSQTEALVAALSNAESSSASVNAALTGFASQYGFAVQLDKSAPPAAQAETLFATMNPQLATYNPLGAGSEAERAGQTASLATAAATLFFGSPVGLAAGGTAMLLDLRSIAFPDTQFRSSFAEPLKDSGVDLCGQRGPLPPHTRAAYIWASRIPNTPTPSVKISGADFIPVTQKSPVPVEVSETDWKYLQRARKWALRNDQNQDTPVTVLKLGNQKAVEIDLSKVNLPAGDYHLTGYWDWTPFVATGEVHLRPLSDFKEAKLDPASQDQLLAKSGKLPVTLLGSDFEFTTKVELKQLGDEFATAEPVRFLLPKGLREGPQDHMDVQIDTADLNPGNYELLISQQDGKSHPLDLKILPNPPKVDNLPIIANAGEAVQHYVLKGERLALLTRLEAPGALLDLSPPVSGETERNITLQLKSNPQPGTILPIKAYLQDRSEPLTFSNALEITGPLPVIASSKLSLPSGMTISLHPDEFPAGATLTAMLDVKNIERKSMLRLACADGVGPTTVLHIGEQTTNWNLQQLSQDQLFLAFDTTPLPAGCSLEAAIDNGQNSKSQPFVLAHIVRLPQIDSFASGNTPPNGNQAFVLTGQNLEMIEKVGWDETNGTAVAGLPTPIPGLGQKQSISVTLPVPPTDQAPLFIWLRGDKQGRSTTLKSPPSLPAPLPAPATSAAPAAATPTNPTPPNAGSPAPGTNPIPAKPPPAKPPQPPPQK